MQIAVMELTYGHAVIQKKIGLRLLRRYWKVSISEADLVVWSTVLGASHCLECCVGSSSKLDDVDCGKQALECEMKSVLQHYVAV